MYRNYVAEARTLVKETYERLALPTVDNPLMEAVVSAVAKDLEALEAEGDPAK